MPRDRLTSSPRTRVGARTCLASRPRLPRRRLCLAARCTRPAYLSETSGPPHVPFSENGARGQRPRPALGDPLSECSLVGPPCILRRFLHKPLLPYTFQSLGKDPLCLRRNQSPWIGQSIRDSRLRVQTVPARYYAHCEPEGRDSLPPSYGNFAESAQLAGKSGLPLCLNRVPHALSGS